MADLAPYGFGIVPDRATLTGSIALSGDQVHAQGTLTVVGPGYGPFDLILWEYFDLPIFAAIPNPPYGALIGASDPDYPWGGKYVLENLIDMPLGAVGTVVGGPHLDEEWQMQVVSLRCWTLLLVYYPPVGMVVDFDLRWRNGAGSPESGYNDDQQGGQQGEPGTTTVVGEARSGAVRNEVNRPIGGTSASR